MSSVARILVVDDNPVNLEICREILEEEFDVVSAGDGSEAIRLAIEKTPHVVLLDVMLPGFDGYETCRRLRHLPGMRHALIVMVTAKAMPAERAEGLNAGADAYITKPFAESELLATVRSWQGRRSGDGGDAHH
jgi:DNA-binding response OmpR family regulator